MDPHPILLIANPGAGAGEDARSLTEIAGLGDALVWPSTEPGEAERLAERAAREEHPLVVVAGGDGTVHEVVNGLLAMEDVARRPLLGILPAGTGNDLCRSLGVPPDLAEAAALLTNGRRARIDLVRAEFADGKRYLVNVGAGGWSGAVSGAMDADTKAGLGPFAYVVGAARALGELRGYPVVVTCDELEPKALAMWSLVVANGRFVAGGIPVVPTALLDDGLLDVLIVLEGPLPTLATLGARLRAGRLLEAPDEQVVHCRVRSLGLELQDAVAFNLDGELQGQVPIRFAIEHAALEVIAGPEAPALSPTG